MTQRKTYKRKTMRSKRLRSRKHRSMKKHLVKKHRVKSKRRTRKTKKRRRKGGVTRGLVNGRKGGAGDDEKPYPSFGWEFSKSDDYSTKELFDMLHPQSKTEFNQSEKGKPDDAKRRWLMSRLFTEQLSDQEIKNTRMIRRNLWSIVRGLINTTCHTILE